MQKRTAIQKRNLLRQLTREHYKPTESWARNVYYAVKVYRENFGDIGNDSIIKVIKDGPQTHAEFQF